MNVVIVGAGVIGLAIARELNKRGIKRITVVEKGPAGQEASWAAAGMLAPNIESAQSQELHRFCLESRDLYPEIAAELRDETGIDIELDLNGVLNVAFDDTELEDIAASVVRLRKVGIDAELLDRHEMRGLEPALSPEVCGGALFPNDGQVENRKLIEALLTSVRHSGVEIREYFEASSVGSRGPTAIVRSCHGEELEADQIILAGGAWTSLIDLTYSQTVPSIRPVKGQMISFANAGKLLKRVVYGSGGYVLPRADSRLLCGATVEDAGFDQQTTVDACDLLKATAERLLPALASVNVADQWAGLRPMSWDGLPVIGWIPGAKRISVASAHYRNGILLAPRTAELVTEMLLEESSAEKLTAFSPKRFINAVSV